MENIRKKKKEIILTVLLAGYLIFNGILLAGHELWRDEANVWLLARELSPLQLMKEIRYQGHPCLWYLMVMPFAKLGFPFKTISVLSYLVMAFAAGVFIYKAPFHPVTKIICLISPIFSYYYPVVARNYCLIALILMLLAVTYPRRNERPLWYGLLLGLLVQADTIALSAAGLISCMWLWEGVVSSVKEKKWMGVATAAKGLWIPALSLLLWIAEFMHVSDSPEFRIRNLTASELVHEIRNISYSILMRMTGRGQTFALFLILLFLAAGILISVRLKNIWPVIVAAGMFLFEVIFSIMVYQLHIWHYIAICFALIWCLWLGNCKGGLLLRILSEGFLILLAVTMFIRWNAPEESSSLNNAFCGLYSDGVNAADYIRDNISKEELIFSTDVPDSSTVLAYLGRDYTFYYAGNQKPETYANYSDDQRTVVSYHELLDFVWSSFPGKNDFYLLVGSNNCINNIPDEVRAGFEICYQTRGETARGENYTLYRVLVDGKNG